MTTFDERERGFETKHARDADLEFRASARRNKKLGAWAGARMGLSGQALDDYVRTVVRSDLQEPGDEDVYRKITIDLSGKGVQLDAHEVRAKMDSLLVQAREELASGA